MRLNRTNNDLSYNNIHNKLYNSDSNTMYCFE